MKNQGTHISELLEEMGLENTKSNQASIGHKLTKAGWTRRKVNRQWRWFEPGQDTPDTAFDAFIEKRRK